MLVEFIHFFTLHLFHSASKDHSFLFYFSLLKKHSLTNLLYNNEVSNSVRPRGAGHLPSCCCHPRARLVR
ncbi:hypothetical protein EYC84_008386 [Monilinia fructicola]|uniref:Uncharacterized protein n=1 Tax=Monilinia fructicola TaxID=38448 RepID=A0A5M9JEZ8_MONFR|nr:hypothetical protein EYC84_008386 [Monilinia fructicola]